MPGSFECVTAVLAFPRASQPGATHEVSNNASQTQPARLLAMIFAKKESTLTTPVQGRGV
jgi:hypothetical protein